MGIRPLEKEQPRYKSEKNQINANPKDKLVLNNGHHCWNPAIPKKPGQEEEEGGDFTFHGLEEVAGGSLNHTRHLLPTKSTNLVETWRERKKEDVWSRPGRRIKDG